MPVPPILWCTSHRPSPSSPGSPREPGGEATSQPIPRQADDTARAAVNWNTALWKKAQLTVAFQEKQFLEKWGIDETTILEWANRWKQEQVPSFVSHGDTDSEPVEKPDIIVKLNDSKKNKSKIGCSKPEKQPRMWLDLSDGGAYREHVVVHEFGHILGLEHEHQRSDFREKVGPYLETKRMKKDVEKLGGNSKDYESQPTESSRKSVYDPDSVMHYWFKKEWLVENYDSEDGVKKQRDELAISDSEMKALLGVIRRDISRPFVTMPSEMDHMLLREVYGGSKQQTPSMKVIVQDEPADLDLEVFKKDLMDDHEARKRRTKMVVQHQNLYMRLRKKLVDQKDVLQHIQDTINFAVQQSPRFEKAANDLTSETAVKKFFLNLPKHAHYLDFNGILDHLIRKHGDDELKEDAKSYRHEFLDLLGRVTVEQAVKGRFFPVIDHGDEILGNFSKVKQHILKKDRLIDIIIYWEKFMSQIQLHHLLSCMMSIEKLASYMLTWLVPTDIVPLLVEEIKKGDASLFKENMVASISVETVAYSDPDFKSYCSSTEGGSRFPSSVQQDPEVEAITGKLASTHIEEASGPATGPLAISHQQPGSERRISYIPAGTTLYRDQNKSARFINNPILSNKGVDSIPGISEAYGDKLRTAGFYKAQHVLNKFLSLKKDESSFKDWLKAICRANAQHQDECYNALNDWCNLHAP